jgi:hypothetical protein
MHGEPINHRPPRSIQDKGAYSNDRWCVLLIPFQHHSNERENIVVGNYHAVPINMVFVALKIPRPRFFQKCLAA